MNDRHFRYLAVWLLAIAAGALTLVLAAYGPDVIGQGASPVSPVSALPWMEAPPEVQMVWWEWIVSEAFWSTPPPWVAVGLLLFGALAGVLVRALHRVWPVS